MSERLGWVVLFFLFLLVWVIDKEKVIDNINMSVGSVEAGILRGIVIGDKSGIDREMYGKLVNSGLIHLMVASGANVMLLAGLLINNLAGIFGRKKVIVFVVGVLFWYAGVVDYEASILRAVLLVLIMYLGQLLGRRYDWKRGLILVVGLLLVIDFGFWKNTGFWLSIVAFLIITIKKESKDWVKTIWVGLGTAPIIGFVFGKISLAGVLTNILVLFLVETVTVVGWLGVLVSLLYFDLGRVILYLVIPILRYISIIVDAFGQSDLFVVSSQFNVLLIGGWYLILWYLLAKTEV